MESQPQLPAEDALQKLPIHERVMTPGCNYHFIRRANELDISNGSPAFHQLRTGKISASRVAALCGLSAYSLPIDTLRDYYVRRPDTEDTLRGRLVEPRTRLNLIRLTHCRMPLRLCGIFTSLRYPQSITAMPDDVAFSRGSECIIEYKAPRNAYSKLLPTLSYICQIQWQMATLRCSRSYLIYNNGPPEGWESPLDLDPGAGLSDRMRVWEILWSPELYRWLEDRALLCLLYLDDPRPKRQPPCIPWLYHILHSAAERGEWIPGHRIACLPPAPHIREVDFAFMEEQHP